MHISDNKLKNHYQTKASQERKDIFNEIRRNSSILGKIEDGMFALLQEKNSTEQNTEYNLRLLAIEKFKNNFFLEALSEINKAINLDIQNPSNYLVRGYIYAALYKNFTPGSLVSTLDKTRNTYANEWHQKGIDDFQKVIELSGEGKPDLFIEAKVRLAHLKAEKAFTFMFDLERANMMYADILKDLNVLLIKFNDNKKIVNYINLIKNSQKIINEDLGITAEINEQ